MANAAIARPRLLFRNNRGLVSTSLDEKQVVNNVVSALQPAISKAVADALAGLQTSASSQMSSFVSPPDADAQYAASESLTEEYSDTSDESDVGVTTGLLYSFKYRVSDNDTQTYISQAEQRNGANVTGTYRYVNPSGSLITVKYQAGPLGYTQTLDQQDGFVEIRSNQEEDLDASYSDSGYNEEIFSGMTSNTRIESIMPEPLNSFIPKPSKSFVSDLNIFNSNSFGASTLSDTDSSSSSSPQSILIAQIISALQSQISEAVQSVISSKNSPTTK